MAKEGYDQGDDSAADAALGLIELVIHETRKELCMMRTTKLGGIVLLGTGLVIGFLIACAGIKVKTTPPAGRF